MAAILSVRGPSRFNAAPKPARQQPRLNESLPLPLCGERCALYFFSPSAAFSSEAVVLQVTVPMIAGSQPFDPPVADPVPVDRKSVV